MSSQDFSIARLKREGKVFEVIVNSEEALKVKKGEGSIEDALLVQKIFKDARKGDVQGDLKEFFGTDNILEIAKEIIVKGEVQLSEEYRHKLLKKKYNRIVDELTRKASDPNTNYPIPRQRIELGIEKIGYKVRLDKGIDESIKELMELLKKTMPITFKEFTLTITSPPSLSGRAYGIIKEGGEVISQEYTADGSSIIKVKVSASKKKDLSDKLSKLGHGLIKIMED